MDFFLGTGMENWQKGEFGNPINGRKKLNWLRAKCLELTPEALKLMWNIGNDDGHPVSARIKALSYILDQGSGKAPQSMEVSLTEELAPNMMSTEQLKLIAAGKFKELIFGLIQSGEIEEYLKAHRLSLEANGKETVKASGKQVKRLEAK
jgi:hypothetical protein